MHTWLSIKNINDLDELLKAELVGAEYDAQRVVKKLKEGISEAVKGILIERNYIDKDYRSTYYHFYSKKGRTYSPYCLRLHFFDETVEPPPIKESISGVNPDKLWATLRRHINGTEALYGGADYRIFAAG